MSEIDSFNLTDQAGISDIQISIDSSSDNSLIDTSTGLKTLHTNIDSYLNKREEFQSAIDILDPDIICMVEILPKVKVAFNQCEYDIRGYQFDHSSVILKNEVQPLWLRANLYLIHMKN